MQGEKPFRVLSLDGGGMRGTYTATYLSSVAKSFAKRRSIQDIDLGAAFNLIVGTSTGGIIACALAAGIPLATIANLYREHGPKIFRRPLPQTLVGVLQDSRKRSGSLQAGTQSLKAALTEVLNEETIGQVYARRGIALAITAVEMSQHRSWVFKSRHLTGSNGRDDGYSLVDVCLATSAAPIYRSMAQLKVPDGEGTNTFVDGGLWANNPVLVGMIDALGMTSRDREIEIFCMGTCPMPAGETVASGQLDRGLGDWQYGGEVAKLSIDAQEFAYDNMAKMLSRHLDRASCRVVRFPREHVPAALMSFLSLDDTRPEAIDALISQAQADANMTNSFCNSNDEEAKLLCGLFNDAPELRVPATTPQYMAI